MWAHLPVRRAAQIAVSCGLAVVSAACDDPLPAQPAPAATVRFAVSEAPMDVGAVPFPSDLYRDAQGVIRLGALPSERDPSTVTSAIATHLARRSGFCTTCGVSFFVDGALPELPEEFGSETGGGPRLEDGVALVNVDPSSAAYLEPVPVMVAWDAELGVLGVRPRRGHVLEAGRAYAAVVTTALFDGALGPSAELRRLIARDHVDGTALERASKHYEPALDALGTLGVRREEIAGLTVFTTDDPSKDALAVRERVQAAPRPVAHVERVVPADELDELLGRPAAPGAGIDLEPAAGTGGTRAIAHETTAFAITGWFDAPRFVGGEGSDVGELSYDARGLPVVQSQDRVPFLLLVPKNADLGALPIVISHHGFSASRTTGFALGDTAGRAGYAVLSIDAYQHGARAADQSDEVNSQRGGLAGADGFPETTPLGVSLRVFGLAGVEADMVLYPGYALAAFQQFAADTHAAIRLVREGDIGAIRAAATELSTLSFDPDAITFVGNSMGAVVGTAVVTSNPDLRGAVLNVMPGSIIETLCESGEFRPMVDGLFLSALGLSGNFDEVERKLLFHPMTDLYRWVLEPVDPLALAPFFTQARAGAAGAPPKLLVQLAGHDEIASPAASESVVAASGMVGQGDFAFASVPEAELGAPPTAGGLAVRFDGAMHGMLEMRSQSSRFEAPPMVPVQPREADEWIVNPTDVVHAQIEALLGSLLEEAHADAAP